MQLQYIISWANVVCQRLKTLNLRDTRWLVGSTYVCLARWYVL